MEKMEEYLKLKENVKKSESMENIQNFSDFVFDNEKEIIFPMFGKAFHNLELTENEISAIISMLSTCLCESQGAYVQFAISDLDITENDDLEYEINMDAIDEDGNICQIGGCVDIDSPHCVNHGSW